MKSIVILLMLSSISMIACENNQNEVALNKDIQTEIINIPIDVDTHKRKNKHSISSDISSELTIKVSSEQNNQNSRGSSIYYFFME